MQPIRPDASVAALGVASFAKSEVRGRSAMPIRAGPNAPRHDERLSPGSGRLSHAELKVLIHSPPAVSQQTFGSSAVELKMFQPLQSRTVCDRARHLLGENLCAPCLRQRVPLQGMVLIYGRQNSLLQVIFRSC